MADDPTYEELEQKVRKLEQQLVELKQAKEELRENEPRYRTLVEAASRAGQAIVIVQDTDQVKAACVFGNDLAVDITGYSQNQLALVSWLDIIHPISRDAAKNRYEKRIKRELIPGIFEISIFRKNGSEVPIELASIHMEFQGKDALVVFFRDITDRKKAEEEKRKLETQLQQAHKMEAIGTLAGGIAHDFNNILGIIIGNTELAIMDVPEWNPAKECLQDIRAASMRAKDVVRQILSFTRKTPSQRKPIQISTIIRDSLKLMRASIPTTIEIRRNISCTTEMILADSTEINQVLMNLCTNALHAMEADGDVLEVNLESISLDKASASRYEDLTPGDFVKLTVKDTGQGIDPEIIDRIFDPYFTTKDVGKGTGMGLAVAYGIVKKHDGAITASSELGIGTVVEVLFPLIDEGAEHGMEEEPQALPTGTERILFVDDEESLVKMVRQMLERLGYEVVTKTNPKEALALFKTEPDRFDLVITDMAMPQMAGRALAQELLQIRQDIPIILCTGHSDRIDEDSAKELGIKAYVMKPLAMREFALTLRKVLDTGSLSSK